MNNKLESPEGNRFMNMHLHLTCVSKIIFEFGRVGEAYEALQVSFKLNRLGSFLKFAANKILQQLNEQKPLHRKNPFFWNKLLE